MDEQTRITNEQLRQMAKDALDNWIFDAETDPDGACKCGLEYLVSDGDLPQEAIDYRFNEGTFPTLDKWEILDDWARYYGKQS